MNKHLRTISIIVAFMLLTGATEQLNNISFAESGVKFVSRGVPREAKNGGEFKSYMDFRCITDKDSEQYKFQKECKTDNNGLRRWNFQDESYYCVAMGSFYGTTIGTRFRITLEGGDNKNTIYVVLADCKDDKDTDKTNTHIKKNGNIIEFLVSQRDLNSLSRKMGDVSYCGDDKLQGEVVKIEEIKED